MSVDTREGRRFAVLYAPALAALAGANPFLGFVSNCGVLLWTAAAAISLFTAMLLHGRGAQRECARFLLAAGLLTAWLTFDDLFMLHEWLFAVVLGIPQLLVLMAYAVVVGLFLVRLRVLIARSDKLLLGIAGWLGYFASVAASALQPRHTGRS